MLHVSVYPKTGRPVWYAALPDPKSGKRVMRATEFRRDDPQGKRKAWNWAREQARDGLLVRDERGGSTWGAWVEPWLRVIYHDRAATLTCALNWWSWVFLFLQERGLHTPRTLERQHAFDYIAWRTNLKKRSGKQVCFNSAVQEVRLLARVMREAIARGYAERNPLERLGVRKDKPAEKPEMTDDEIESVRRRLARTERGLPLPERWRCIAFEVALHTGCRHAETEVPFDRIDWEAWTMRFHAKRGAVYTIPVHPGLRPLLLALRAAGAVRTCRLPAKRESGKFWSRFFNGQKGRKGELAHLCFHCTRVTVITRFARAGVPLQQAMAYVHHADGLIHKIYQRLRPADIGACVLALNYPPAAVAGESGKARNRDGARANAAAAARS